MSARTRARLLDGDPASLGRPFEAQANAGPGDPAEELDTARAEALQQGYDEGLSRARQEMDAEIEAFRVEVGASLKRIVEYEKTFADQHETQILELVVEVASRIARERIEQDDPVALRALREALDALPNSGQVRARLHPDDVDAIRSDAELEINAGRLEIVADEAIARGGTLLETELGTLAATIETAERQVSEALLGNEESA